MSGVALPLPPPPVPRTATTTPAVVSQASVGVMDAQRKGSGGGERSTDSYPKDRSIPDAAKEYAIGNQPSNLAALVNVQIRRGVISFGPNGAYASGVNRPRPVSREIDNVEEVPSSREEFDWTHPAVPGRLRSPAADSTTTVWTCRETVVPPIHFRGQV